MPKKVPLEFLKLCAVEPRLWSLYRKAKREKPGPGFCANRVWYVTLKPQLVQLVGWHAERPELRTSHAYDLAYDTIYEALPDCQHEDILCL